MNVYFDNAATTKVCEESIEAMVTLMRENYGNPSSTHYMGRQAAEMLGTARANIAATLGAPFESIYFTSGGTEANNWAVLGLAKLLERKGKHIITSMIEHDAVYESCKKLESLGWEVTYLFPDNSGRIPCEDFTEALREDTAFASIMLINNETGAENPIREYSNEIKRRGFKTLLHTDAVQGFCKTPISVKTLGADLLAVSAHKIHGPKGVGALYISKGVNLPQAQLGGGQENSKRPGTEALPAIVGFGEAALIGGRTLSETAESVSGIRSRVVSRLKSELPDTVVIGGGDSPYLLSLSLPGHKSEVIMSFMESEGICVSKSSSCKKGARSRVLESMRLHNSVVDGAIRVSFSKYSTTHEADFFVDILKLASEKLFKAL